MTTYDNEIELWEALPTDAWKNSVANPNSIFRDLYEDTRRRINDISSSYDVILEVGCGTGEVLATLDSNIPRIGVDINPEFIEHCNATYKSDSLEFYVADATEMYEWWNKQGFNKLYKKPLVLCANNTIMILPESIREIVLESMRCVAGKNGRCMITFWNGRYFAHGVLGFYKKNPALCGNFDLTNEHIDWDDSKIKTDKNYQSCWLKASDVVVWMHSILLPVEILELESHSIPSYDHVCECGMGIYLWLNGKSTDELNKVTSRDYYDSNDAQLFYTSVWGENHLHLGRYDLVQSDSQLSKLNNFDKVQQAQLLQEEEIMRTITGFFGDTKIRVLDMGVGYGGLLRSMAKRQMLWSGVGVDVSSGMIDQTKHLNSLQDNNISSIVDARRESFLCTSLPDEGVDLVISMDSFLHVGPKQHASVLAEAWRVLRPGGRMIFTDIVAKNNVDRNKIAPLFERIGLDSFATVETYQKHSKDQGFENFNFEAHSKNISLHYDYVYQVLCEKYNNNELNMDEAFKSRMTKGLCLWRDLADSCLDWGVFTLRKKNRMPKA